MASEASFSISVQDGRVEVSGSEDFVREQINEFKDIIKEAVKALGKKVPPVSPPPIHQAGASSITPSDAGNPYPNVIALEEDIKVLKTLPGSNKAAKARNAALLVLLGKKLKGEMSVPTQEIRDVCKTHACFDQANFSSHLKAGKEHFIISGKGSSQVAKLSHPGEVRANELAKELNGE